MRHLVYLAFAVLLYEFAALADWPTITSVTHRYRDTHPWITTVAVLAAVTVIAAYVVWHLLIEGRNP